MFARAAAKSHDVVQNRKWRTTADEDGHYSFAVALRCGRLLRAPIGHSATDCGFALRPVGVSCAAPPPRVPKRRDRPRCDIAHQPDLGHIPSVGERFCDDRELAPA